MFGIDSTSRMEKLAADVRDDMDNAEQRVLDLQLVDTRVQTALRTAGARDEARRTFKDKQATAKRARAAARRRVRNVNGRWSVFLRMLRLR